MDGSFNKSYFSNGKPKLETTIAISQPKKYVDKNLLTQSNRPSPLGSPLSIDTFSTPHRKLKRPTRLDQLDD